MSAKFLSAVAILGAATCMGVSYAGAAVVNLGFNTNGTGAEGWTLPDVDPNTPWEASLDSGNGGPNTCFVWAPNYFPVANANPADPNTMVSASAAAGDALIAGQYTINFEAASQLTYGTVGFRMTAYDLETGSVLGFAEYAPAATLNADFGPGPANADWDDLSLTFTIADGSASIGNHLMLGFTGTGVGDNSYIVMSTFSAEVVVPEPASLGLLSLAGLGLLRRCRKA